MAHKVVYLIRHARTSGNLEKRYIGRKNDQPLAKESVPEAEQTARELLQETGMTASGALRLCSGPMKRAADTAAIFAEIWKTTVADVIDDLTEIDFGDFEGKNYDELNGDPRYQAWIDAGGTTAFPGGESRECFVERSFTGFLRALGDHDRKETVAIVCHGGNIMAILSRLTGEDYYKFMTKPLDCYRLDLEMDDEGITDHTFCRIVRGYNT